MQIYPLVQTVVLHGNSKHPIIIIDASNCAWGVALPNNRKSFIEMDDLEDSIHDEILQSLALPTHQPTGNWIIRVPYSIRYFTPSSVGQGDEVTRTLGLNLQTHALISGDVRGNLLINSPVILVEVQHSHLAKESISKVMQLALGNEIEFISDSVSVVSHIMYESTHDHTTYSGNPYRVLEEAFGDETLLTQVPLPQRLAQLRYLLDSKNNTQLQLSDVTDASKPPVGSEGYLDFELSLNSSREAFRPRIRRSIIWTPEGFYDMDIWRYTLSKEERQAVLDLKQPYCIISLDAHIFDSTLNEYFEGRLTAHPNYPGLMVSIYQHQPDKGNRPVYKTALELFTEMPLAETLGLPAFTGTTADEAEAHLVTYIEAKHPDIMDALRFNGLLETIKSIM